MSPLTLTRTTAQLNFEQGVAIQDHYLDMHFHDSFTDSSITTNSFCTIFTGITQKRDSISSNSRDLLSWHTALLNFTVIICN